MTPSTNVLALARAVRERGFFAPLGRDSVVPEGMAAPGALLAIGPDALSFLHSQVTNEVQALAVGEGNQSARVTRQGQLTELFSLHRLPDLESAARLLIVLEQERVAELAKDLDTVLFADRVELTSVGKEYTWTTLQGPGAEAVLCEVLPIEASWLAAMPECGVKSSHSGESLEWMLLKRSLGGDVGFLLALARDADVSEAIEEQLAGAAGRHAMEILEEPMLSQVLEVLRIESGVVRIGPDTRGRRRILPETGLEQQTVSYTKGCYLGQEVIARVRTYGALPFSLRGLLFRRDDASGADPTDITLLDSLPEPGEPLALEDGKKIGEIASRTLSPVMDAPIAYAYLDKAHRLPGDRLRVQTAAGVVEAEVCLLPFYSAPGAAERVAWLYDRSVRVFASGDEIGAQVLLEEALRIDPSFSDGYEALGVMLGRGERFHEAIDIFKRLEEIAPQEPIVNTNLSLYYMKIGDKELAEDESAKAMQKSMAKSAGRNVDAAAMDDVMAEQKRTDARRKKEMFAQVLEIDPVDPVALFGLGNALVVLEEWAEAARIYASASEAEKDSSAIYLAHGKVLERLGRDTEAEAIYRAGMEVASRKGDLMPLKEMEHRALLLSGSGRA
jgi:folate-binding protein YgfZ